MPNLMKDFRMWIVKGLRPSTYTIFLLAFVFMAVVSNPSAAKPQSNVTVMTYGRGHGTQVEYLGSNGMSYLWYPGNRVVLAAPWKQENGQMCYLYGKRTYNPVTNEPGGKWECRAYAVREQSIVETGKGDIFGLSKRRAVPFVLPKARTTLSTLAGRQVGSKRFAKPDKIDRATRRDLQRLKASCPSLMKTLGGRSLSYDVAGGIYFWGGVRTKKLGYRADGCVAVDYAKAFNLFRLSGDSYGFKQMVDVLNQLAREGNAKASAALNTVNLSPPEWW
ncbi:MAG: hypothetical protein NXI17_18020 [Alphaproteobacteria bacterium]|nr:hypothetical protein [Alphaproteobacteria bacterium]